MFNKNEQLLINKLCCNFFHSLIPFTGTNEPIKLTCSQLRGLIVQLEEHCTNIAEVMSLIPFESTLVCQLKIPVKPIHVQFF